MGKTALVTGGTKSDIVGMAVLAINLRDKCPKLADELIIFHDGISSKDQSLVKEIFPCRFLLYQYKINKKTKWKNSSLTYFSDMVFCKFECFRLLNEFETVIWTDYDILIRKPLDELTQGESVFKTMINRTPLRAMFFDSIDSCPSFSFDMEGDSVSTALIVLKRGIGDYNEFYRWCYEQTEKYAQYLYLPEQAIFTMLIQYFDLRYERLDEQIYAPHPSDYEEKASIIHAYGQPKFWNGLRNEQWEAYYQKWRQMGGSAYRGPVKRKLIKFIQDRILKWRHKA